MRETSTSFADVAWGAVSIIVIAFFFALIVHSIWKAAKNHPSACSKRPNGVRGGLLVVASWLLALGLFRLASAANIVSFLNASMGTEANFALVFMYAGPSLLAALVSFIGCHRLACSRSPAAVVVAVFALWAASVGFALVQPLLLGTPRAGVGELCALAVFSAAGTLYLIAAPRSRHTYGFRCDD